MPFCSATWAIALVWPESNAPTSSCAPFADQPLGPRARDVDVRFRVGVHDRELRQAEALQDRRRQLHGALAVLSDQGLYAGARQQHADLQRPALGSHDRRHGERGADCGGARQERTPGIPAWRSVDIGVPSVGSVFWLSPARATKLAETRRGWNCGTALLLARRRPGGASPRLRGESLLSGYDPRVDFERSEKSGEGLSGHSELRRCPLTPTLPRKRGEGAPCPLSGQHHHRTTRRLPYFGGICTKTLSWSAVSGASRNLSFTASRMAPSRSLSSSVCCVALG